MSLSVIVNPQRHVLRFTRFNFLVRRPRVTVLVRLEDTEMLGIVLAPATNECGGFGESIAGGWGTVESGAHSNVLCLLFERLLLSATISDQNR